MTKQQFMTATFGMAALILTASPVFSQNTNRNCGPRDGIIDRLAERYGEARQSIGLGAQNQVVEVYASTETGTWTILVRGSNGMTCMVASGQAFENVTEALPASGTDA